ncbi:MAG: hypothetical protein NVSMB6_06480 [Burkholderiaceae bacterium]
MMDKKHHNCHAPVANRSSWFAAPLCALLDPPFKQKVAISLSPVAHKSKIRLLWRWLRPWLTLIVFRQFALLHEKMEAGRVPRVLWIYKGTPQVGDALMDLSSRVLLRGLTTRLDLLTDPHLAKLFAFDDIFSNVQADPSSLRADDYDVVILDSFKARCLREKLRHFRKLPFVTMRGYFSGPEFNRTVFSFYRMQQLLWDHSKTVPALFKPHLVSAAQHRVRPLQLPILPGAVAFAIGGAVASRTYEQWDAVIDRLRVLDKLRQVVLLGSENAVAMAERICAQSASAGQVVNCVAQYSLLEAREIMKRCDLVVCCDGGLMHVANSAGVPMVALFDSKVDPNMRFIEANRCVALQSADVVSQLPVELVTTAIGQAVMLYAVGEQVAAQISPQVG